MPLKSETITVEEAVADLENEKEELADEVARIDPDDRTEDNDDYLTLTQQGGEVVRFLGGLDWIRTGPDDPDSWKGTPIPDDGFGAEAEFTLTGLNTSETLEIGDRVDDLHSETITPTQSADNMASVFWVAKGLEDAPFINAGDEFEAKCAAVRGLPKQVTDWLETRINDLSTVGEREGNSFGQLVEEKTEKYHQTSS